MRLILSYTVAIIAVIIWIYITVRYGIEWIGTGFFILGIGFYISLYIKHEKK